MRNLSMPIQIRVASGGNGEHMPLGSFVILLSTVCFTFSIGSLAVSLHGAAGC